MSGITSSTFTAIGTTATVAVTDPGALDEARRMLAGDLDALDTACSRFRPDSELRRLPEARGAWTGASPLLVGALRAALRVARLTGGLVVPTMGHSLVAVGYDRDASALGRAGGRVRFVPAPGWRTIGADAQTGRVRVPEGVALDLGATAKAFAADRSAEAIASALGCGVLVSLGGDMRVAGTPPPEGWPVLIGDDHRHPGPHAVPVRIHDGGLATSSTWVRRWQSGGRRLHHLLDPRSGAPADGPWRTVTVTAATCLDANAASTASVLLGERAPAWLAVRGLPARLVAGDGSVRSITPWPEERAA